MLPASGKWVGFGASSPSCRLRVLKNHHPGDDLMAFPKKKLHIFRFFHVFFPLLLDLLKVYRQVYHQLAWRFIPLSKWWLGSPPFFISHGVRPFGSIRGTLIMVINGLTDWDHPPSNQKIVEQQQQLHQWISRSRAMIQASFTCVVAWEGFNPGGPGVGTYGFWNIIGTQLPETRGICDRSLGG